MVLLTACLGRPPAAPTAEVVEFPVSYLTLPNGVRVVIEQAPQAGVAGATLVVGVGSADEPVDKAGIAHLAEHLVFRARHDGALTLWQRLNELGGGSMNGMTSWDTTTYYSFVPEPNLGKLLALIAEVVADPLAGVDEEDFQHELGVVRNEARLRTENGTPGQVFGWLAAQTFPKEHPYSHPVVGTQRSLSTISMDDVRAFVAEHYASKPITLVVSSPKPTSVTREAALQAFADAPPSSVFRRAHTVAPSPQSPPQPAKLPHHLAPVPAAELWLGWLLPGAYEPGSEMADVAGELIEGTFWRNVQRRHRGIARVRTGVINGAHASIFYVVASLNDGADPEACRSAVLQEMRSGLGDFSFGEQFRLYKHYIAVNRIYAEEQIVQRALRLADSAHFTGDARYLQKQSERILSLESGAFASFWREHLHPDRARSILVRPASFSEQAVSGPTGLGTGPTPTKLASRRAIEETPEELRSWISDGGLNNAQIRILESGLEVIAVPRPGSPFNTTLLGFRGGNAVGTEPGVATAALWSRSVSRYSMPSLKGAQHETFLSVDAMHDVIRLTGDDAEHTLNVLSDVMKGFSTIWPIPQFSTELELFRKEYEAPSSILERARTRALLGNHPLAISPGPDDINRVRANHVYAWQSAVQRSEATVVVIVGDMNPTKVLDLAEQRLAKWHHTTKERAALPAPPAVERAAVRGNDRVIIQHRPRTAQVELGLSCLLPRATPQNSAAQALFARMLSTHFLNRLRIQVGASYGAGAELIQHWGGTSIVHAGADVDYARLVATLLEIRRYTEYTGSALLGEELLRLSRTHMAREHNLSYAMTGDVAYRVYRGRLLDWPLETLVGFGSKLMGTTLADIQRISDHCRNNWVLALLGDARRIQAAWDEARRLPLEPAPEERSDPDHPPRFDEADGAPASNEVSGPLSLLCYE